MSVAAPPDVWAVLPAAGLGRRIGTGRPKQYLPILGRSILEHSLRAVLRHPRVCGAVVVVAAGEESWELVEPIPHKSVHRAIGGAERADSVLAGLDALCAVPASPSAWVLVHDAARPCLPTSDLDRLLVSLESDSLGGILAAPAADTLKRCDEDQRIVETLPRGDVWQAQTPQMFRLGMLRDVLGAALRAEVAITDEASAMEWAGHRPKVVRGSRANLKVTHREDLRLVEALLRQGGEDV